MEQKLENNYTMEEYEQIIAAYRELNDEELLDVIRKKAKELGRPPKKVEVPASHYFKQKFGPWPRVLEAAGVKVVSKRYLRRKRARKEKRAGRYANRNME